jgi:hypothetical protein
MNCPEWEDRIAGGDPESAEHLRECPSCRELAAGLARDAQLLRAPPTEVAGVNFAGIRAAARHEAGRRRRRKLAVALAVAAAAVLAVLSLPLHRETPRPVARVAPMAAVPREGGQGAPPPVAPPRPRRRKRPDDLDRRFAGFLRAQFEARHPGIPSGTVIATRNPHVSIVLVRQPRGDGNE